MKPNFGYNGEMMQAQKQGVTKTDKNNFPRLHSGDRLTVAEFERRYEAHPEVKKAELVEGVVYVSSPVYLTHSETHSLINGWLFSYIAATPGIRMADNQSVLLDQDNEVQPDLCAWSPFNSSIRADAKGLLLGSPDLVIEVAASSASYDLFDKLHVYRRNQVQEYLVLSAYERETHWFSWLEGSYMRIEADEQGILSSLIYPGLALKQDAFWENDVSELLAALSLGIESEAHTEYVKRLREALA